MPIRANFPEAGSTYHDGQCDGYEFITVFAGSTLGHSYDMLKNFLSEEGYADVPLPATAEELLLFKNPRPGAQMNLFNERAYVHNPIRIRFHRHRRKANTLILHLYNEQAEGHLLRFHGVG